MHQLNFFSFPIYTETQEPTSSRRASNTSLTAVIRVSVFWLVGVWTVFEAIFGRSLLLCLCILACGGMDCV